MKSKRPVVVIVGAGFGGLAAVRSLESADVDIVLIDQRNHHLFQPLLYQVATAWLSPADIAAPIRSVFSRQENLSVVLGRVIGVDAEARTVRVDNGVRESAVVFDYLILATGARHDYFGNDAWAAYAPGLKTIEDAVAIRERLLTAFEMASDPAERDANLTIVIVGGGATGVEMAGSIAELARAAL
ncbi:MAG: FAD-dependent oxidoreductase, partial [Propionivibrio sp.]|nr:FAD-dependent oxidoreductase [Propionivibrio sp.]